MWVRIKGILSPSKIKMEFSMKSIMVFIITCGLFFTFGCNYDYGKYGKNKTESGSGETNGQETIPKQEAGSEN